MTKTIYLANPYGFSAQQKAELLPPLVSALEELGLEVWEPFARNNQVDFAEAGWAYRIGQADFREDDRGRLLGRRGRRTVRESGHHEAIVAISATIG